MNSLFKYAAAMIEKAAKSPLGILALMVILLAFITYSFFSESSEPIRFAVFLTLLAGISMYVAKVLHIHKEEKKKALFTWNKPSSQQHEELTDQEQIQILGQDYYQKESTPNLPIPDNDPIGITSPIEISDRGILQDISVGWRINHPYAGDLVVKLISPSGKSITLHDRGGGSRSVGYKMESHTILNTPALNTLIGEQIQGKWMLAVSDLSTMDVGELANWGIKYACESNL